MFWSLLRPLSGYILGKNTDIYLIIYLMNCDVNTHILTVRTTKHFCLAGSVLSVNNLTV